MFPARIESERQRYVTLKVRKRKKNSRKYKTVTVRSAVAALCITSLSAREAAPEHLAGYVRRHWHIENKIHYVRSPGVHRLSHDVAPEAPRRASATHLQGCGACCRCWSNARCLRTRPLAQHLWRDYRVLIIL